MVEFIEMALSAIMQIINSTGYWGIGAGMALESACIPIPSEVVLPLAGNMIANGTIDMLGANISVAFGSLAGSLIAYAAGYYGGRPLIIKYGRYFFVSKDHFNKAESIFNRYGAGAVFFGRMLPVIRTFISLPAGIAHMNLKKFILYSLTGMIPWNFLLIFLGFKFGEKYQTIIRPIFKKFEFGIMSVVIIVAFYLVFHLIKTPSSRKKSINKKAGI